MKILLLFCDESKNYSCLIFDLKKLFFSRIQFFTCSASVFVIVGLMINNYHLYSYKLLSHVHSDSPVSYNRAEEYL